MGHDHAHDAASPARGHTTAYAVGIGLNLAFVLGEAGVGLVVGSLALIADAGHNLSDVLGLALAWAGAWLAQRPPSPRWTYGQRRASILAALGNAMLLLVAIGAIAWEAIARLIAPAPPAVPGGAVMIVAGVGIVVNGLTAWLFLRGRREDVNVRGAFLHMVADTAVSAGVVVAGLVIRGTGWGWVDPVTSLLIAIVIAIGTWGLLRQSVRLALDAVPEGVDPDAVRKYLAEVEGVREVHDLHVWPMSTTERALTAHLVVPDRATDDAWLAAIAEAMHDRFDIGHVTIQVERGDPKHAHALHGHATV